MPAAAATQPVVVEDDPLRAPTALPRSSMRVRVASVDEAEAERVAGLLGRALGAPVGVEVLRAAELRGRGLARSPPESAETDRTLTILVHVVDGRTLLVDRDGLYNAWFHRAGGDVALALTPIATPPESLACDLTVAELVDSGQSSVWPLHRARRFVTFGADGPTAAQLRRFAELADPATPPLASFPTDDMLEALGVVDATDASSLRGDASRTSRTARTFQHVQPAAQGGGVVAGGRLRLLRRQLAARARAVGSASGPALAGLVTSLRSLAECHYLAPGEDAYTPASDESSSEESSESSSSLRGATSSPPPHQTQCVSRSRSLLEERVVLADPPVVHRRRTPIDDDSDNAAPPPWLGGEDFEDLTGFALHVLSRKSQTSSSSSSSSKDRPQQQQQQHGHDDGRSSSGASPPDGDDESTASSASSADDDDDDDQEELPLPPPSADELSD
mmetsp:Transcript_4060/g.16343  ORF Transcript_4060/g.16343 Transcript_4060/m.16343 type:complete len:448 (-) Transcript_4060:643-1986(-)